jgi:hypothetical protein
MNKFLLFLTLTLLSVVGYSQTSTVNPDTVCYQTNGSIYTVPSLGAGYTYTWTVAAPGVITSGAGTNTINVNWSSASPGLITNGVTVYATNTATGCQSAPITLNVLIYNIVPTITAIGPFCQGAPCVTLTGSPAGGVFSGTSVVGNQFCPTTSGTGTFTITYTVTQGGCTFTTTTTVTVSPNPVLSPIQHN